jgi:hypothetical protein
MNKETEQAFETVRRAIKRNRFMVHEICAAYLGCDPDDVVLRCRKKNGGNYAKSETWKDGAKPNKADG